MRAVHRLQQEAVEELVVGQDAVGVMVSLPVRSLTWLGELGGDGVEAV
jgi:hypothetical protein